LDRRYGVHGDLDTGALGGPIEGVVSEDIAEKVLEDDHHGEALDAKVPCTNCQVSMRLKRLGWGRSDKNSR
jgi:hypothetical protein